MKFTILIALFTFALSAFADTVSDSAREFSIDAPKESKFQRGETSLGSYINISFRDEKHQDAVMLQAMKITNGGDFGEPIPSAFAKFVDGISDRAGRQPHAPNRTILYQGRTLYLTTHLNIIGAGPIKSMTTICYFEGRTLWRKMLILQFMSGSQYAPSDADIITRLNELKFQPSVVAPASGNTN